MGQNILPPLTWFRYSSSLRLELTQPSGRTAGSFVIAGMMCIPKNQTIHRVAKQLGLASHDTLERTVMSKCWTAASIMSSLITFTLTYISGTPFCGYLILDDVIIPKRYAKKLAYVYWDHDYITDFAA